MASKWHGEPGNWTRQECRCPSVYDPQVSIGDGENRSKIISLYPILLHEKDVAQCFGFGTAKTHRNVINPDLVPLINDKNAQ